VFFAENRFGAVAQLGERVNGIHEVEGSIPFSSTNESLTKVRPPVPPDFNPWSLHTIFCTMTFYRIKEEMVFSVERGDDQTSYALASEALL
jgi:hypothetical protein